MARCSGMARLRFGRLDEETGGERYEGALTFDVLVHRPEPHLESLDTEAGDDPDHQPQEEHDRSHIVEHGAQPLARR